MDSPATLPEGATSDDERSDGTAAMELCIPLCELPYFSDNRCDVCVGPVDLKCLLSDSVKRLSAEPDDLSRRTHGLSGITDGLSRLGDDLCQRSHGLSCSCCYYNLSEIADTV